MKKINNYKSLSSKSVEEELKRLKWYKYYIIIKGFWNYNTGDLVVSIKTKSLTNGDIIAFYHGNKILVKRVIAGAGSWVNMDEKGNVYVNGKKLEESYIDEKSLGECDIDFPLQVPDGHWFVLSDKRGESIDSRNSEIGCISQENIIGKIVFRVWPIN